ncbi:MAG: endonuclease/exonuclease/phosphatase family protein [Verrucomicrobiaceae bacterium]|nr:endonuclease/exonuclease/phosphatase family protein [Verrucomicrobiaceae bacterium]
MELASEVLTGLRGRRPFDLWWARSVVALSAGVFVATLLAVFSVRGTDELASWWGLAMFLAFMSWGTVALTWQGALYLLPKAMGRGGGFFSCLRFLAVSALSLLVLSVAGMIAQLPPTGLVITFVPFVIPIVLFWIIGCHIRVKSCLCAVVLLVVVGTRLYTLPSGGASGAYPLAEPQDDDVRLMSWNLGGRAPFFRGSNDADIGAVAEIVRKHEVHVLCLQGVSSRQFLDKLLLELGHDWKGGVSSGGGKSTAVLSRIGGEVQSPLNGMDYGGPTVLRIRSHKGMLQFVSCHGSPGRKSWQRRKMVDWILHEFRGAKSKTVIAGDFNIDTSRGWTFLAPMLSDSLSFDLASWRALAIMGEDPGFDARATSSMGRRSDWVMVDSKMPITGYRVLQSVEVGRMDHFPVLLRVGLGKAGRGIAAD